MKEKCNTLEQLECSTKEQNSKKFANKSKIFERRRQSVRQSLRTIITLKSLHERHARTRYDHPFMVVLYEFVINNNNFKWFHIKVFQNFIFFLALANAIVVGRVVVLVWCAHVKIFQYIFVCLCKCIVWMDVHKRMNGWPGQRHGQAGASFVMRVWLIKIRTLIPLHERSNKNDRYIIIKSIYFVYNCSVLSFILVYFISFYLFRLLVLLLLLSFFNFVTICSAWKHWHWDRCLNIRVNDLIKCVAQSDRELHIFIYQSIE